MKLDADIFSILYVALGGSLGAVARFLVSKTANSYLQPFPLGTLTVNFFGSLLLGFIMFAVLAGKNVPVDFRNFFAVGFIGAFTTMSTFAYESFRFWQIHEYGYFFLNIGANMILSLGAVAFGGYLVAVIYH